MYEGDVESGVDKTYSLVMQGLDTFREKMLDMAKAETNETSDAAG